MKFFACQHAIFSEHAREREREEGGEGGKHQVRRVLVLVRLRRRYIWNSQIPLWQYCAQVLQYAPCLLVELIKLHSHASQHVKMSTCMFKFHSKFSTNKQHILSQGCRVPHLSFARTFTVAAEDNNNRTTLVLE